MASSELSLDEGTATRITMAAELLCDASDEPHVTDRHKRPCDNHLDMMSYLFSADQEMMGNTDQWRFVIERED